METIAILAPSTTAVTPKQSERARIAIYQQMMLIARGYSVDHPAVRSAAEIVASAVTRDPVEFALAEGPPIEEPGAKVDPREAEAPPRQSEASRSATYARYLETIFSTQPS